MKHAGLIYSGTLLLALAGCSTAATPGAGTGGSNTSGSGGSSSGSTGGSTGSSTGGSTGSSTGGSTGGGTGGSTESGTGGATGSGTGGSTGTGTGGSTGTGTGGTTGTGTGGSSAVDGGTDTGTSGTGGAAKPDGGGTAGAAGGLEVAGSFDGALALFPCKAGESLRFDCAPDVTSASDGSCTSTKYKWTLAGDPSKTYTMTFRVLGIMEVYYYNGGTREAGNASIQNNNNLFIRGGALWPGLNGDKTNGADYNSYQLLVTPAVQGEANTYGLNSVIQSENAHDNKTLTEHRTFPIDYSASIKVMGGGTIALKVYDSNCTEVQNCGNSTSGCPSPRTVTAVASTMPPPPASFVQPYKSGNTYGQWVYFDVTDVK